MFQFSNISETQGDNGSVAGKNMFLMGKKLMKIYDTGCEIKFALSWRSSKHAQNCMTSKLYHCTSTKENTWFDSKWWILWRASIYSSFS